MYGEDFKYDEMLVTGPGDSIKKRAVEMAKGNQWLEMKQSPVMDPPKKNEVGFDVLIIEKMTICNLEAINGARGQLWINFQNDS